MKKLVDIIVVFIASVTLVFGLIAMATPMPGATALAAGSMAILICASPRARRCLQILRTKWSRLNKGFFWVEEKVGSRINFIGDALNQTRPSLDEEISKNEK